MLVLSRRTKERVLLRYPGGEIWLTLLDVDRRKASLGIQATKDVEIYREEVVPKEPNTPPAEPESER